VQQGENSEAVSENLLVLKVRAGGFYILKQKFSGSWPELFVDVDSRLLKRVPGTDDRFSLVTGQAKENFREALGESITIESITVDSLFFTFSGHSSRRLPVKARISAECRDGYMILSQIITPDSITAYGDPGVLSSVDTVFTEEVHLGRVDRNLNGAIRLLKIKGVRFSRQEVVYDIEIIRYMEKTLDVEVEVINLPSGMQISPKPEKVKFVCRMPYTDDKYELIKEIKVLADFNKRDSSGTVKIELAPSAELKDALLVKLEPQFVNLRKSE
jgi:YbbR domain-containing protein